MADKSAADQKLFISLIRVAQKDAGIRDRLRAILHQPAFHRKSMLHTLIAELKMQSAPAEFIRAIACLLDDAVARKARELLDDSRQRNFNSYSVFRKEVRQSA
jgi:hypothetical protein